jgi:hypothetical protein
MSKFGVLKENWYRFHARNITVRNKYHLRKLNITNRSKITIKISILRVVRILQ